MTETTTPTRRLRNPRIREIGRKKRKPSPARQARAKEAGALLRKQITAHGVKILDVPEIMELEAKTTLLNHIRKGSVTLLELCEINDYWEIDVNAIIDTLKDERYAARSDAATTDMTAAVDKIEPPENFDLELDDEEKKFAEQFGITDWGAEESQ